jgi:hypothetical protein
MAIDMYNFSLINMKTLMLMFIGITSAFLAVSCRGDRKEGQKSVLKLRELVVFQPVTVVTAEKPRTDSCFLMAFERHLKAV